MTGLRLVPIAMAAALVAGAVACSSSSPATAPASSGPSTTATASTLPPTGSPLAASCPADTHQYTPAELDALHPAVVRMLNDHDIVEYGTEAHFIEITLQPGREKLAAALEARFRNAVSITVGRAPYHCGIGTAPTCPALTGTDSLPAGLHLTLKLGRATMPASASFDAQLIVENDEPTPLGMDPGEPVVALIVRPGTRTVVGTYSGPIGGTGLGLNLRDGQQRAVKTIVGAWRCDGRPGSTLPPGRYGVRAGIGVDEGPPTLLAPEVPLTITR